MKIAILGTGYVVFSNTVLLSKYQKVVALETRCLQMKERID
jgi:UDP-glucose 6-dehydrogenase